jgi:NAD(P)-dependent dehydrogenase (short-subunit alcohol dehydrogenase family)
MRLRGKVALLTGAAAAIKGELMGFGGAAAHLFVREGAKVVRHPRRPRRARGGFPAGRGP